MCLATKRPSAKTSGAKLSWRPNITVPKRFSSKTSWRKDVGAKMSAPKHSRPWFPCHMRRDTLGNIARDLRRFLAFVGKLYFVLPTRNGSQRDWYRSCQQVRLCQFLGSSLAVEFFLAKTCSPGCTTQGSVPSCNHHNRSFVALEQKYRHTTFFSNVR